MTAHLPRRALAALAILLMLVPLACTAPGGASTGGPSATPSAAPADATPVPTKYGY